MEALSREEDIIILKNLRRKKVNKTYYDKNKDYHNKRYKENKEYIKLKNKYFYYKRHHTLQIFQDKFPNDTKILIERGVTFN